ncbi:putative HTH-type transcriptional regulator YbgA [Halolactibacillus alkaliphilus]|uniref:Putative HTH-type transcriptional regulator YbgA n=1 Tax=Halolactibacillus alkaliphilus TaxID=442899 RepID=A0A511WZT3_9BACI|nr:GntR family transcriptional regulator [Halolactibacillus alkaliphilus]GEN56199.1 putative HTH-type transcriptional regulator YbgA [Halolactibacillus alkaliphilus]GGN66606.1 putative HTH-type transcriptional regulator YbgA [Halolactibacillus alkaliphilus]SFO68000.1 GntR family transcriptional regulator [Halolactibacillus alkaliphilus]
MLEKKSKLLYHNIKRNIIENIDSGKYIPGDKLPTEQALCEMHKVSRTTVRIALQQLVAEGYIYKEQGKGTFVSTPKVQQSLTAAHKKFTDQMAEQGYVARTKVIELSVIEATEKLSKKLDLKYKDPVNRLVRVRYADQEPLQYEIAFIPWKHAPGLINEKSACEQSLFKVLEEKYKLVIHRSIEKIEPVLINEHVSDILDVEVGSPVLSLETTTYDITQQPIEYCESIFRGDRSKFTIERLYKKIEKSDIGESNQ